MTFIFRLVSLALLLSMVSCHIGKKVYAFFDSQPSGAYKVEDESGRIVRIMQFKDGKLHGQARGYYPDERVKWITHYRNGIKQGKQRLFYKNGNVYSKVSYEEGLMEGPLYHYTEDGKLHYSISFKKGKVVGPLVNHLPQNAFEPKRLKRKEYPLASHLAPTKGGVNELDQKQARVLFKEVAKAMKPQKFKEWQNKSFGSPYPSGGAAAIEAWKFHCLIHNIDYEEVIEGGI